MPKVQIKCPNCQQPILADIEQLFDVGVDPDAKQRLLSGSFNQISCPICGYQGMASSQIVYHDPAKELLITYTPPEMGLNHDEQERRLGSLINQVVNNLPAERRKAYLLQPQTAFTLQGLIEKILEADGITKEMIDGQQKRLDLIQRLLVIDDDERFAEMVKQEDVIIDAEFFMILRSIAENAALSGNQDAVQQLTEIQNKLLPLTTFGQELQAQEAEIQAAVKDLQELGEGITREQLLDLLINTSNDTRLGVLVSLTRPGLDYQFFQLLSERIDRERGDGRARLVELRDKLLELTEEIDRQMEARAAEARSLVDKISQAHDIENAMMQALPAVDEFFVNELETAIKQAESEGDLEKLQKYQQMKSVLQKISQETSPEIGLIEELLEVPEDENQIAEWRAVMDAHRDQITPEFVNALANITNQASENPDADEKFVDRLRELNRQALRYSMEKNLS